MDRADRQSKEPEPPPRLDAAARALRDLHEIPDPIDHLEKYLTRLCAHAVDLVTGATIAGVTLLDSAGNPSTAACTAPAVEKIDALQYLSGSGPCLDATEYLDIVLADHTDAGRRWPGFAAEARGYGVVSFLSVPLPLSWHKVHGGAVNVYGTSYEGFRRSQAALLNLLTAAAGYALTSEERYRHARTHTAHLEQALASRGVIDQAKGILMAVHAVDADSAFALLVETSQRNNQKVRLVAEELVAGAHSSVVHTSGTRDEISPQ